MDDSQLLTQVLGIEKLEVRGSKIAGAEEISIRNRGSSDLSAESVWQPG